MTAARAENLEATIHTIYDAFGRGDVPAITALLDENVDWEFAYPTDRPIPWLRRGTGPAHAAAFFGTLAQHVAIEQFAVRHVLVRGTVAVVLFDLLGTVRDTGRRIVEIDEAHIWHFNDAGQVVRFRHAADTLQQHRALAAE